MGEGVPDPGRHAPADRPHRRGPAVLLRQTQEARNVQVIADPCGRLLWASPALPGAVHDIRAAREHGIVDALAQIGIPCWADKGYRGAGGTVRIPCRGRWDTLSTGQKAMNQSHAKIRALAEQAVATLKSWRLLRKLRCSTTRITSLVQAVLTLHLTSSE
ncbi:transposase family protein [Streptomyces sp. DG2A-72]|uniref:transposase family protein n=1 Tax=Streptomyces sp. DG2A-72 TaxID=3051386 RepID=UPI00265C85E7|nr:transposase family protein [Streptomyces sp. DG2A-72]MDO0932263.1 transposase family protein [Streptomyces sp. DG2A-72]